MNMKPAEFAAKFGALLVISLIIGALLRLALVDNFVWNFVFVFVMGFPILFIETSKLKFGHVVAIWITGLVLYAMPWYAPGTYDGIDSRIQISDFWVGKHTRATPEEIGGTITDNQCRNINDELRAKYNRDLKAVTDSDVDPVEKSTKLKAIKDKFAEDLNKIQANCDEPAPSRIDDVRVTTADYKPSSTRKGQLLGSGDVAVNRMSTDIGTYSGKVVIVMSGSARLDSTRENFGPCGWKGGGPAPNFFNLPGAPMFGAVADLDGRKQAVCSEIVVDLSKPTSIKLGPNEEPGKDGLGLKDNSGSWHYEVYKAS